MTEINTNAQANRLPGLASGIDTEATIEKLIKVEERRLVPIQNRKAETEVELTSFETLRDQLKAWNETAKTLSTSGIWEGKLVESSNDDVVTATATAGAAPGNHTLVVDRLALNHQISSQGYETTDTSIGKGRMGITVGEETPITISVDESNNTLQGLRDAINNSGAIVTATIIRTGDTARPHQLVLTSQNTGTAGRMVLEVEMRGGEPPNFGNFTDDPSSWAGVGEIVETGDVPSGEGASNSIVRAIGTFTGEDDKVITFTAIQTGRVGAENPLQVRWKADTGESGNIELDSFNYAAGEPVEVTEGLSLVFSEGDVVVGDSFTVRARTGKSDLFWWLDESERTAAFSQPSRWNRQETFGGPIVEGIYTGEDDTEFTLTVEGSGQVGRATNLAVRWENDEGESGLVKVGNGYQAGSKLAIIDGITLALESGILHDGDSVTFEVEASDETSQWWKSEAERAVPAIIEEVGQWESAFEDEEEEFGAFAEFPEDFGPRISSTEVSVDGSYQGDDAKVYTFTALSDGTVGTTKDLKLRWVDDKGNSGVFKIGSDYVLGNPVEFDSGLSLNFTAGRVFEDDSFTLRTHTSTIQPPQDSLIRFGATEFGGGLEITNTTNELNDVIEGVKLHLVSSSEKPVTITIKGDTEKAFDTVLKFAQQYNEFAAYVHELTRFNTDTKIAAPLLGNRDIDNFKRTLTSMLINPVGGLPPESNMLFSMGMRLDNDGLLQIDEEKLRTKVQENFGAVADLFRAKGETENSGVSVVGISEDTQISVNGYRVDITQLPTRAKWGSPLLPESLILTEENNKFFITVDGRQSETIEIPAGEYSVAEYARTLQNEITKDEAIGGRRVRVLEDGRSLQIMTGIYGTRGSIEIVPSAEEELAPPGLFGGETFEGLDTEGTINNEPAEGMGQILRGADDSKRVKGLRLFITLAENQLNPTGPEAMVKITKGVASRVNSYLTRVTDPLRGEMKRITDALRGQIDTNNTQLDDMKERIQRKRKEYQKKFTRLETKMALMRSQQRYMASQLGGGGGSALPGLPG